MKRFLYLFTLLLITQVSFSQSLGEWRSHLPLHKGSSVAKAGNKVYVAAYPSVFVYDIEDESIEQLSKVNELSDLGATVIKYSEQFKTVIIGYETGNIDLIVDNIVINIPDISRSFIQGNKAINNVSIYDEYAYLSTGFGIVVLDILRREIKETYTIGDNGSYVNVADFVVFKDTIYAASKDGLYYASFSGVNLSDFQVWNKMAGISSAVSLVKLAVTDNEIYIGASTAAYNGDTIYRYKNGTIDIPTIPKYSGWDLKELEFLDEQLIIASTYGGLLVQEDLSSSKQISTYGPSYAGVRPRAFDFKDGIIYIADERHGLVINSAPEVYEVITPEGPGSENCWDLSYSEGAMWVATGALKYNLNNFWNKNGVYQFKNEKWINYNKNGIDSVYDITTIAVDPNNPDHVFFGSWGKGLGEIKDGVFSHYSKYNSPIKSIAAFNWQGVGGLAFDDNGLAWIVNTPKSSNSIAEPLLAYNGTDWYKFTLLNEVASGHYLNQLYIDKNGYKWIATRYNGIIVFDDNGTLTDESDDRVIRIQEGSTAGDLPSNQVHSLVIDDNDKVWIGTEKGLAVIQSINNVFDGTVKAERIIIEQDESFQYLLETEAIRTIVKDGGNRKWVGTFSGGAYLISEDGQETIHHFTIDNSPILGNNIIDIEVFGSTGEVFFATEKGLVSFASDATDSESYNGPVYAFPNPVRSSYSGIIGIRGLVGNSEVKITDTTGNLVFETIAEGGTATWDGKTLSGKRVQTGVYIVFSSNDDGSETEVTKILFIN
tara:strand:+ start:280 stop:2589 length:2310 start_codon:yes stop_codon:yes gene_type:complete